MLNSIQIYWGEFNNLYVSRVTFWYSGIDVEIFHMKRRKCYLETLFMRQGEIKGRIPAVVYIYSHIFCKGPYKTCRSYIILDCL
jgi:hypothetical protein